MKAVLTIFIATILFTSPSDREPTFLTIQSENIKAKYRDQVTKTYPDGFIKHFEIVKVNPEITSKVRLPGIDRDLRFHHKRYMKIPLAESFGDQCTYMEGVFISEDDSFGHRILKISKYQNAIGGQFWVDGRTFELSPLDEEFAVIIEIGTVPNSNCGLKEKYKKENVKSSSVCTPICSGGLERIRFVIDSELRTLMQQFVGVLIKVVLQQVTLQITIQNSLVNPIYVSSASDIVFPNTTSIATDVITFKSWINNNIPTVDKAVLLTSHNYVESFGDVYGVVNAISGKVAIVEVRPGHPDWLSAHEVGHLYGGRHQGDTESPCAKAYKNGSIGTPIVSEMDPYVRQNYYSAPGAYGSTLRWNAGIIQNQWCN